jgi:hypothetical protein
VEKISKDWKEPVKLNKLIENICEIQRKGDRKFINVMTLSAPRWVCGLYSEILGKQSVRQFGVHMVDNHGRRLMTNLETLSEALVNRSKVQRNSKDETFDELLQKN